MHPQTTHRRLAPWPRVLSSLAIALAVVGLIGGLLLVGAARPDTVLATGSGSSQQLKKFKINTIGSKVAGQAFSVVVEAQDASGKKIKTYNGTNAVISGLAASPGGNAPTYSAGSWSQGIGTFTVTAYRATTSATVTVTDATKGVSKVSNAFVVAPGAKTLAFTAQPVDTEVGAPIRSSLVGTPPVRVLAADAYGNPFAGLSVTMSTSVTLGGTTVRTTGADGSAAFDDLKIGVTGSFQLTAAVGSVTATSVSFTVVADLAVCDGATCQSVAAFSAPGTDQSANTTIKTTGDFDNTVILTTTFSDPAQGSNCVEDQAVFGRTTEVQVTGAGLPATAPSFQTILIYSKETLEAAGFKYRLADTFDICLGAKWLGAPGAVDPWRAKKTSDSLLKFVDAVPDGDGFYWGWAASCLVVSKNDPCIVVRARTVLELRLALGLSAAQVAALGFEAGDLAIVVRKPWPWDGKMSLK